MQKTVNNKEEKMSVAVCLEEERGRLVYEGEEGVLYPAEHWDQPAFLSQDFCLFVCLWGHVLALSTFAWC